MAYQELQSRLSAIAASLNDSASQLFAAARGSPEELAVAAKQFAQTYQALLEAGQWYCFTVGVHGCVRSRPKS